MSGACNNDNAEFTRELIHKHVREDCMVGDATQRLEHSVALSHDSRKNAGQKYQPINQTHPHASKVPELRNQTDSSTPMPLPWRAPRRHTRRPCPFSALATAASSQTESLRTGRRHRRPRTRRAPLRRARRDRTASRAAATICASGPAGRRRQRTNRRPARIKKR